MKQRKVSKDSGADFGNPQLSDRSKNSSDTDEHESKPHHQQKKRRKKSKVTRWSCVDTCCWFIGCVCVLCFVLSVLYHALPESVPQFVAEKINGPLPDPPGTMLKKEGLLAKHPVVFVPGIVTGGLEMWEGKPCADGLFRKRLWGGSFGKIYTRPKCWMEHIMLDNETGLDPEGIRVRPVSGLVAADYFAPGYFVWAVLIENLASIGYEEKNMYMTSYDWRLTFQNTEVLCNKLILNSQTLQNFLKG
jgi:phospholipid:diacylglycerol acyltransferase